MNRRDVIPMLKLPRPALATIALVFAFGFVSEQSYQDEKRAEAMKLKHKVSPAPIWSKRCENQGQPMLAKQADGGEWIVYCTGPKTRT